MIKPIDTLKIVALMDNVADPFTRSHEGMRWNECQYRKDILNKQTVCGADFCRACNGLSLLIEFGYEGKNQTILFDTGPDEGLVVDNAKRMGIDMTEIDTIVYP